MGKPGWEDETWTPGQSSRGNRADNPNSGERNSGRPYDRDRSGRGDPDPRSYDRSERRSPQYTDESGSERQRSTKREDEWRGTSSGRSGAAGGRRTADERGSLGSAGDVDRSGRNRPAGREDYADYDSRSGRGSRDYRGGGARDPRRPGYDARDERTDERGMKGQRPPTRAAADAWSPPRGSYPGRNRPPDGRLPGGESNVGARPNRPRPGYPAAAEMSGYGMGGRQSLEELRARRLRHQEEEPEEEKGGFNAGAAFLVILLMLLLGSGGAYAYFKVTTPTVHSDSGIPSSSPNATSGSFVPQLPAADSQIFAAVIVASTTHA